MGRLKGTKTIKNLMTSFAGECQARTKYNFYASVARKEGYEQIASIFDETAANEKEHAEVMLNYAVEGMEGELPINEEIQNAYGTNKGDTYTNLIAAAEGEHGEWYCDYPRMADEAEEEGFKDIAISYRNIAKVEKEHEERYLRLAEDVKNGTVFEKEEPVIWKCRNCGFIVEGKKAPKICPACKHPQAYFEVLHSN